MRTLVSETRVPAKGARSLYVYGNALCVPLNIAVVSTFLTFRSYLMRFWETLVAGWAWKWEGATEVLEISSCV